MRWTVAPTPPTSYLEQHPDISPILAQLLYHRGIVTQEQIDEFLAPDYSCHVHDPFLFRDMHKAVTRLFTAIERNEPITIYGDYDADGVSASVILTDTLRALGATDIRVYLPHRETDGYGLNSRAVQYVADQGTQVLITCDCGISNVQEIALATELDIDVIVTDHHAIPPEPPAAYAIIHPKVPGETYPYKDLAGGGVAFKLAQALLHTHAKTHDTLPNGEAHDGFEKWLLEMVAIASVADMVPLIGESRTLTKYGLIVLNKTRRIGMKKLFLEAGLLHEDGSMDKPITARTIGFTIAPRINAAGRIEHANTAYKLLVTDRGTDAVDLAWQLEQSNSERRTITDEYVIEAIAQVEREQMDWPILFVLGEHWTTGVVGLIASKLKSTYHKPAIAMGMKQAEITGSGRSVEGFNLIAALQEIPQFFAKYGGHPMACGFTLAEGVARTDMQQALISVYEKNTAGLDMSPSLHIDAEVQLEEITWDLYDQLEQCEPYGQANPKPIFLLRGVTVASVAAMGKQGNHMRLMITHTTPVVRKVVGWNLCAGENDWCSKLQPGMRIDCAVEIGVNEWNGHRELQLTIVDLRVHTPEA